MSVKKLVFNKVRVLITLVLVCAVRLSAEDVDAGTGIGLLTGKNVVLLGDSNTWIAGERNDSPRGWNYWFVREAAPLTAQNYARSGATWSHTGNTHRDLTEYSEVITDNNVVYNQIMRLIADVDSGTVATPDLIIVSAGTNDAWFPQFRPEAFSRTAREAIGRDDAELLSLPPGRVRSLPDAVKYDLLILSGRFPDARIVVLTPLQSVKISSGMLEDVTGMIEDVSLAVGVSVIRQDILSPVRSENEMIHRRLTTDGIHTSEAGAKANASVILEAIRQILQ